MDDMITLFRGDDTAFGGDKSLRVTIETRESLADCCAELEVCGVVKRVRDVSTGTFYVSFTGEDTARMPLGEHTATLRVFDAESRRRTVSNTIRVRVTERVDLVYANEQSVNVALGAMVAWRNVRDKPSINGVVLEGDKTTKELGIKGVVEAELVDLPEDYTTDDLRTALNKINACLRASMASLALAACALLAPLAGFCAATETNRVETQKMGAVSSKSNVVTDVCLDGLATAEDVGAVSANLASHISTKSGNPHGVTAADVKVSVSNGVVSVNGEKSAALDAGDGRGIALGSATNLAIVAGFDTNTLLTVDGWEFSACQNSNYGDPATGRGANHTNVYASVLYPDGGRILTDAMIPTSALGVNGAVKKADEAEHAASADTATTAEGLLADDGTQFLKYTNADDDPDSDDEDWAWRIGCTTWYDSTTHTNVSSRLVPDGTDFVTKKTLDAATKNAVTHDESGNVSVDGSLSATGITASGIMANDITATSISVSSIMTTAGLDVEAVIKTEISDRKSGDAATLSAATNAAQTAITAATNGLVTASVTNGLASAAALSAHVAATDNPHNVTAAQVGALTAESDPVFAAWTNGYGIAAGEGASVNASGVALGYNASAAEYCFALGYDAKADTFYSGAFGSGAEAHNGLAFGYNSYISNNNSRCEVAFAIPPDGFWLGSVKEDLGASARTLQSYLDERAKRYALVASASASISAADGNLYALTADTNGVAVTLPAALADYAQDFVLRVVAADTNGTQIAEISGVDIDLPNGDVFADGSLKGTNYVTFTQTTASPATWSIGYFAATKEEE